MKRFFLPLIVILVFNFSVNAQKKDVSLMDNETKLQYQIDYTRHCLKKYSNQKLLGYYISVSGLAVTGSGILLNPVSKNADFYDDSNKKLMYFIGGGISLIGVFTVINSEKWMKRAYIGPDGLGVKFSF